MDAIELLLSIKGDNPLPENKTDLLRELFLSPFEMTYEEISSYSHSFTNEFSTDRIKQLLRKGGIIGENPEKEIRNAVFTEEERWLMYLFFKGHVQLQIYENNKHPFIEGEEEYEQDYDAG